MFWNASCSHEYFYYFPILRIIQTGNGSSIHFKYYTYVFMYASRSLCWYICIFYYCNWKITGIKSWEVIFEKRLNFFEELTQYFILKAVCTEPFCGYRELLPDLQLIIVVLCNKNCKCYLMLNPHNATLHHETLDRVGVGGSFNRAYRDTAPCFMVQCCTMKRGQYWPHQ